MSGVAVAGPLLSEITDGPTGCVHLVTDTAFVAGRRGGCYVALCGYRVLAASLTAPERGRCQDCRTRGAAR